MRIQTKTQQMDDARVYGKAIDIDSEQVKEFYNRRALTLKDSLSTVNLQQSEQAKLRDSHEKENIIPKLLLSRTDRAFEFGCGFGRFAEALAGKIGEYQGLDISSELIKLAKQKFETIDGFSFSEGSIRQASEIAQSKGGYYNLLMTMGVLTYLNDADVSQLVKQFCRLSSESNVRIYIRESVAIIPERLTLNNFWSDNLQSSYTAVYRTIPEYENLFSPLTENGFQLVEKDFAYPTSLHNNAETTQFYFLFTK